MFVLFYALQTISYMAERVVGTGSFGIVFQVGWVFVFPVAVLVLVCLWNTMMTDDSFLSGEMLGNWWDCGHKEGFTGQKV